MTRLLIVLVLALALGSLEVFGSETISSSDREEVRKQAKRFTAQIRSEIEDGRMDTLARKSDQAIENLVERALKVLEDNNDGEAAYFYRFIYHTEYRGYVERTMLARGGYDIGDHAPLSQYLSDLYLRVEFLIGIDAAKALHLSDIHSLNHGLPVVFRPCSFSMDSISGERIDEYRRHFNEGAYYYGVIPVISYWLVNGPCMVFSSGIAAFLCGPIASAVEFGISRSVGPKLSDYVFTKSCN